MSVAHDRPGGRFGLSLPLASRLPCLQPKARPRTPSTERCSPKQSKARPSRITYPRRRFRRIASRPACSLITVARVRASSPSSSSPSHSHHAHRLSLLLSKHTRSVVALDHHLPTIRLVGNSVTSRRPRARTHASAPSSTLTRHAAGGVGAAAAAAGGEPVGAGDGPVRGRVSVGEGAGDRAEAGGDARDAARPPRVRVRALAHRPRREDRRGRQQRRRGPSAAAATAAEREEGDGPAEPAGEAGRAVRVRQAGRAAGGGIEEGGSEAAGRQREREREEQLPQQQRRRAAQLLHAPLLHPQLHRAAPQRPRPLRLHRRRHRRPRGLQQEGERQRHRQVLADAVGPAVAQVEPAGPGRRVHGDPAELCSRRREGLKTLSDAVQGKERKGDDLTRDMYYFTFAVLYIQLHTVWLFSFYIF